MERLSHLHTWFGICADVIAKLGAALWWVRHAPVLTLGGPGLHRLNVMKSQGNADSKGHSSATQATYARDAAARSPPMSPPGPGSPLQYSPQIMMEPITKAEGRGGPEFYAGQAAGPKLVPVVISCESYVLHSFMSSRAGTPCGSHHATIFCRRTLRLFCVVYL